LKVDINTIKENPHNPRTITEDKFRKLVKSLKEFPEMLEARPIVVDKDNIVLGGNMRLKAAREAGLTEVPIYRSEWSHDKSSEFVIKDNVGFGEWDWDLLANEWDSYPLAEWGLDVWSPEQDAEIGEFPELPEGDRLPYQRLTYSLHDQQVEVVKTAVQLARGALTPEEKYEFTGWLKSKGVKAKQINELTGSFMGSHYLTDKSQPDVPTVEKWEKFKHLVDEVPEHIEQLIHRHTLAETDNENANGNALWEVCKEYLANHERQGNTSQADNQ